MGLASIPGWARRSASAVTCALFLSTIGCGADQPAAGDDESVQSALSNVTVSVDQPSYPVGATITVTYAGLPGNADDWIAIARVGTLINKYSNYVFTQGQTSGTATFPVPTPGSYVARAFPRNTFELLAESPAFTVDSPSGAPTVSVDQSSYGATAMITVTYAGLPGDIDDWVAIAPAGSPNTSYVNYIFTQGQTSGTATFPAPATGGSYVVRAFPQNTFELLAESPAFTVSAVTISTDKSSYPPWFPATAPTITVTYAGLPGNIDDWIAIAPKGSPATSYMAYVFTNGQTSGTATINVPADGTYVARSFAKNTFDDPGRERALHCRRHRPAGRRRDPVDLRARRHHHRRLRRPARQPQRLDHDRAVRLSEHDVPGVRLHAAQDHRHRHVRHPRGRLVRRPRLLEQHVHAAGRERALRRLEHGPGHLSADAGADGDRGTGRRQWVQQQLWRRHRRHARPDRRPCP